MTGTASKEGCEDMKDSRFEFYLPSSDGISRIYGIHWKPAGKVFALLLISHGMAEHIGRYDTFARGLNRAGIAVIGHDHLGHGRTTEKGRHGIFADENGVFYILEDMRRMIEYAGRQYPALPLFLLGHSMGSFFTRSYLTLHGDTVNGAILMGTGEPPYPILKAGRFLIRHAVKRSGRKAFDQRLHNLVLGRYNKPFEPGETKHDWLSRDVKTARAYEADPDCNFLFSNGAYEDLFQVFLDLSQKKRFKDIPKTLPVLLLSGDKDPVGDCGKGVRRVFEGLKKEGLLQVSMKLYPEARHELFNEFNREEVLGDIVAWLIKHSRS